MTTIGADVQALLRAGAERQAAGAFDAARDLFEAAVRAAPQAPSAWAALAACWFAARRPELSLQVCRAALVRLGPNASLICAEAH